MIAEIKEVEGVGIVITVSLEVMREAPKLSHLLEEYGATGLVSAGKRDGSTLTLIVPVPVPATKP